MKENITLGHKIRVLRELKGFKQDFVANELNMTTNGYGKIERNETDVLFSRLEQIAKIFSVSVADILSIDEKKIQFSIVSSNASFHGTNYNQYNVDKEMYEKTIKGLEREVELHRQMNEMLKEKISLLEKQV